VGSVLKLAGRAALWRTTRELQFVTLPTLLGFTVVLAAVRIALQFAAAGHAPNFSPYGLNAVVAWLATELAIAALFVRPVGRTTALSAMLVLSIVGELATTVIMLFVALLASLTGIDSYWVNAVAAGSIYGAEIIWWLGAVVCVLRSLQTEPQRRLYARVAALWIALFVANALMPHAPVFFPPDFDIRSANWWETLHARRLADNGAVQQTQQGAVAQIEQAQPARLRAELDRLAPHHKGATNIYVIGIAGWADQDVFVKELDGALASIANVLPIKDRIVRLINHRDTLASVPLANQQNFAAAVRAVGKLMDKDEDVLVLLMTSHGDQNGIALQLPGKPVTELTPQQVASTLDSEAIKNRVVIVSACYGGIFVPPLANDNTIVMSAADEKSTSFGCAPERDWTYFGDALFRQSMQPGTDFQHAFAHARVLIQGWELMDRAPPSNPQAHFGPALVAKLAPYFASAPRAER
jgi:hypothetical protein